MYDIAYAVYAQIDLKAIVSYILRNKTTYLSSNIQSRSPP